MKPVWRLIDLSEPGSARWNMAVDETLLDLSKRPTLRFYRWQKPALSIGYFQKTEEADREYGATARGFEIVRRITGGGAVFHGEDLTVSMVVPEENSYFPRRAVDSYAAIHRVFLESLKTIFPELALIPTGKSFRPRSLQSCFEEPTACDVGLGQKKVIGSSQRRRGGRLLNQSSILLPAPPEQMAAALAKGFERILGIYFEPASLSPAERERADGLSNISIK